MNYVNMFSTYVCLDTY